MLRIRFLAIDDRTKWCIWNYCIIMWIITSRFPICHTTNTYSVVGNNVGKTGILRTLSPATQRVLVVFKIAQREVVLHVDEQVFCIHHICVAWKSIYLIAAGVWKNLVGCAKELRRSAVVPTVVNTNHDQPPKTASRKIWIEQSYEKKRAWTWTLSSNPTTHFSRAEIEEEGQHKAQLHWQVSRTIPTPPRN